MSQPKEPLRKGCQDRVIQVHEARDRAIPAAANVNVNTQAIATLSQVKSHAKTSNFSLLKFLMQRSQNCVIVGSFILKPGILVAPEIDRVGRDAEHDGDEVPVSD